MEEEPKIKPNIFIDFDNTLIKGKFNESEIPERYDDEYIKKFVTEYYENEDYFMMVLNILQDLKLKYNLYVLSRNENKSLKDIIKNIYNIQTRLPSLSEKTLEKTKLFSGVFLYSDLKNVVIEQSVKDSELKYVNKNEIEKRESIIFSLKKTKFIEDNKDGQVCFLIDDDSLNIDFFNSKYPNQGILCQKDDTFNLLEILEILKEKDQSKYKKVKKFLKVFLQTIKKKKISSLES